MMLKLCLSGRSLRDGEEGILGDPEYWVLVTAPCEGEERRVKLTIGDIFRRKP